MIRESSLNAMLSVPTPDEEEDEMEEKEEERCVRTRNIPAGGSQARIDPSKFNVTESGQVVKEDIIGHPNHYCEGREYEPKDVIRDWNLNFNLGNAVKYISRNGRKDGNSALQDLKKARQYLDFEIEYLEKEDK